MPIDLRPRRALVALTVVIALALAIPASAQSPEEKLDASLRQLEKEIAAARGLAFKSPVKARLIARPGGDTKEKQGYYAVADKTLFVYDDVAGNYQKGVLIHEMVHALQDQHFDLARMKTKLHADHFAGDADLALAALIEGDATFTMIEVLKKEQPKVAAMLDVPLDKAKNLRNAFLYGQGARYVKALKDKGGWMSVNTAYRFPPRTTAIILNLQSVPSIQLGRGETRGALTLLQDLVANPKTRENAVALAQGWRGDRRVVEPNGSAHVYASKDAEHARRLGQALVTLRQANGSSKPGPQPDTWSDEKGRVFGFVALGPRLYVYDAASAEAYAKLRERMEGPLTIQVLDAATKTIVPFGVMIEKLLAADFICVGELHDSEPHHRLQLQIIKALHAYDESIAVGMEMFQRPYQKALDSYVKGDTSEEEFLKESDYQKRWGYDWSLYRPIVEFGRRNSLPLAALNAPRELTQRIRQVGIGKLKEEEKTELGPIDLDVKEHRAHWFERLAKMHGQAKASADEKERGYQVMTVWDDFMARSAASFLKERQVRRLVVLAGSGHIERGFGIPQRTARYSGGRAMTVGIAIDGSGQEHGEVLTDFVILVK